MASVTEGVPPTLIHHLERVRVLHEHIVLLTIVTAHVPFVEESKRVTVEPLEQGFFRVVAHYGFMETPDVPQLLTLAKTKHGLDVDLEDATYFLGRETILGLPGGRMGQVEESIFGVLSRNSRNAGQFFNLPPEQVVEIGVQVNL